MRQFKTGPATDGESCFAPQYCSERNIFCAGDTQCYNNYNTLLLTYRDRLLACGTLHETCDLLMLGNITRRLDDRMDLQCPSNDPVRKTTYITRRNRSLPIVAATYLNNMSGDNDLLYLGRSPDPIDVLIAPSLENSYFSMVDSTSEYLPENYTLRQAMYHHAWADDEYAYVLWTDATNNELKLTRYCHQIISTLSRNDVENEYQSLNQGSRTYTEITLQCNSNENLATDVVDVEVAFNTLYVLFRNSSNNIAKICSSTIQSFKENFDFVRSQCWNSTNSENVTNAIGWQNIWPCELQPGFSNEWVSSVRFAFL